MGVGDLWPILNKAGHSRSLTHLAVVDGFDANPHGTRSFRIGIDAGIWLRHAEHSAGPPGQYRGDSPERCTLFYRLCRIAELPVTFLFVFDGRWRPDVKRGSRMGKRGTHNLAPDFQTLIRLFGMDWREAKGEGEAELANLNALGHIDAVMTDDVDALVFGARMVLKNVSPKLTGNKAHPAYDANGKAGGHHAMIYTADAIAAHPDVQLTRPGLILFALLSGGDYDSGIKGVGAQTAHALARLNFGQQLLHAFHTLPRATFTSEFLPGWRAALTHELHTNASGLLSSRHPSLSVPSSFPPLDALQKYAAPLVHPGDGGGPPRDPRAIDVRGLAAFCTAHFTEWGVNPKVRPVILRFRTLLYPGVLLTVLRAAAVQTDVRERDRLVEEEGRTLGEAAEAVRGLWGPTEQQAVGTPPEFVKACVDLPQSRGRGRARDKAEKKQRKDAEMRAIAGAFVNHGPPSPSPSPPSSRSPSPARLPNARNGGADPHPLILGITSKRAHASRDGLPAYHVTLSPRALVPLVRAGVEEGMKMRPKIVKARGAAGAGSGASGGAGGCRGRGRGGWRGRGRGGARGGGRGKGKAVPGLKPLAPGRRSRRYEDTESESENAPPQQQHAGAQACPSNIAEALGAGDADADEGGGAADADLHDGANADVPPEWENEDPNEKIGVSVPESILRHVHPKLVADYEKDKASKGNGKGKGKGKGKKRATAADEEDEDEDDEGEDHEDGSEEDLEPPAPAPAPAAPSKPKPKPKPRAPRKSAPASPAEDYLLFNPHAPSAPAREHIDPFAPSSLPLRNCGFYFTWPDADDPDGLIVDTRERDDLPTGVEYAVVEGAGAVYREYEDGAGVVVAAKGKAKPAGRAKGKAKAKEPRAKDASDAAKDKPLAPPKPQPKKRKRDSSTAVAAAAAAVREGPEDKQDEDVPMIPHVPVVERSWSLYDDFLADAPELQPLAQPVDPKGKARVSAAVPSASASKGKGKGKEREREQPDASASASASRPAKRRKTTHALDMDEDMRDSSEEPELPWASLSQRSSVSRFERSPSPVRILRSSPAPGPPMSSSPAATPSSARSFSVGRRVYSVDDDVISISSDSDDETRALAPATAADKRAKASDANGSDNDEWWNRPPFNNQPSFYSQRKAAISRGSLAPSPRARNVHNANNDDEEEDEIRKILDEDPWAEIDAILSQPSSPVKNANAAAAPPAKGKDAPPRAGPSRPVAGKRYYRDAPTMPSSSQESMLDDGDDDMFFGEASVVVDLT
ncbi:hypothetical protein OH77DRAFT_1506701 [Trametes cingulata]|nr:hypothetical protein OH77DRAFT_1506701 [Trametes cingulata]